jgi:PleD family two-component response regulator
MHAEHTATKGPSSARLGGARADFVAGLGRKVADLRKSFARVREEPGALPAREELRRKLHALATAAKLMKCDAMERGIGEALGVIDRSAIDEPLVDVDLDSIETTIEDLPALAWGDGGARSSKVEERQREEARMATPAHAVLIVGASAIAEALLEQPDGERPTFGCQVTPDAQAAFDLARDTQPDLVVLDADVEAATELVEALMDDPTTETIPVIVVGSFLEPSEMSKFVALGVTRTVNKPTSREAIRTVCEESLVPLKPTMPKVVTLGEPTLEQLGERLANEIKDALLGRMDRSALNKRIPLGEGTEVLGALWGAIARVREVVTARTDGQVQFTHGPAGSLPFAPSLLESEVPRSERARSRHRTPASEVRLQGRRIVVADDDPAVVWFMADLLKTAGCIVHEAFDGKDALELCYKVSPDLVITDILMPSMDGFAVCRALRRDVALRDTPVILLSWKEDLLQRVRELGAGAAGYVRKESDTRAIVARVREALRPRARLEMRLKEDGEIKGRLDTVSVRTLLEIVCATRPDARVSVRDASFLYEVEIREGAPWRATRTSGDGTFIKGSRVLNALLGVGSARFTVTTSTARIDLELDGNLPAQLAKPLARSRAATMLLSGPDMAKVTRVHIDDVALADYLKATPDAARRVARKLADGMAPRSLVLDGACDASLLDDILCDLAARGLVTAIEANGGDDLLGPAMRKLMLHTDARASLAPRSMTTSPPPACMVDEDAMCESPAPDALMGQLAPSSPEAPMVRAPRSPAPIHEPKVIVHEGTPAMDQIIALGEATVVDDTVYAENDDAPFADAGALDSGWGEDEEEEDQEAEAVPEPSMSIPVDEASMASETMVAAKDETEEREEEEEELEAAEVPPEATPFVTVTQTEEANANAEVPKRKAWPMVAFIAASGVVAWAVMHFAANAPAPKQVEVAPPPPATSERDFIPPPPPAEPKIEESAYEPAAADAKLPEGHGVLEVTAPAGTTVVVDGTERSTGAAKLPIASGSHDVRVKTTSPTNDEPKERGCTVEVHTSRVARVRF